MPVNKPLWQITDRILGCAITVQRNLGPGLLESAYEECLCSELAREGMTVKRQIPFPIRYNDLVLEKAYKIDMIVEKQVIVELKAVERLHAVHTAQVATYLKLTGLEVGLIINFFSWPLKDGIKRVILTHDLNKHAVNP